MTNTIFRVGDQVDLTPMARGKVRANVPDPSDPEDEPHYVTFARSWGPGPFRVFDLIVVPASELKPGHHPQRLRVRFPDGTGESGWISGYWFQLA